MKKRKLILGIFIIVAIKVYSQDFAIDMDTPLELNHFEQIFKKDNPAVPLDTLNYSNSKYYSYDKSLYIQSFPKENNHRLMTYDDKFIIEIPYTSFSDRILWLQNCLVVEGNDPSIPNNSVIYLINFKDNKLSTLKAKGGFGYIGHSDSLCYFYSYMDSFYLGDFFIPNKGTIFSINEKGLLLTNKKAREDDNKIIRKYYNESFSFVMEKDSSNNWNYNFYHYGLKWTYNEPIEYFHGNNVYHRNGITYVEINSKAIYRFDKNNVTKVVNSDTMSIENFKIENNHLIYGILFNYKKPPLGILNLETKQTYYPTIIKKSD